MDPEDSTPPPRPSARESRAARNLQAGLNYLTEFGRRLKPAEELLLMSLKREDIKLEELCPPPLRLARPVARMVQILVTEPKWRERIGLCIVCSRSWYVDTSGAQLRMACEQHKDRLRKLRRKLLSTYGDRLEEL